MGVDGKYGKVTFENPRNIGEDEPVFVFRAKDELLPRLLEEYWWLCRAAGSPENHLDSINSEITRVLAWQAENNTQVPTSAGHNVKETNG